MVPPVMVVLEVVTVTFGAVVLVVEVVEVLFEAACETPAHPVQVAIAIASNTRIRASMENEQRGTSYQRSVLEFTIEASQ